MDPVVVLDEPDRLRRMIRVAAHNVALREWAERNKGGEGG